jgi:uncharacterized protein (DUF305 family)
MLGGAALDQRFNSRPGSTRRSLARRRRAEVGRDEAGDQACIRCMSAHHAQSVVVARIAAGKAVDRRLRALARLMAAEQIGENSIFDQWSRSWFLAPKQVCGPQEQAGMPRGNSTPSSA